MKRTFYILTFSIFLIAQFLFINPIKSTSIASADDRWKNYYGIAWDDTSTKHIKYAKQMGYDYIAIKNGATISSYKNDSNIAGLKFFFIDPITYIPVLENHKRWVSTTQSYTQVEKDWYERNMVWKSNDPFPRNLASGYFQGTSTSYNVEWDWQQQRVIDEVVERVIALVHSYEDTTLPFTFAGILIDVPSLRGEFNYWDSVTNTAKYTGLSYWTGSDSGLLHGTITHEYATYREGKAAYLKKLASRMKQEFPNAKWVVQPWRMYSTTSIDEWVCGIKDRADKDDLTPDMLSQENSNTEFVDNASNFNSGVNITKDRVENTQHTDVTEYQNRLIAAKAGINGAWYNWFGSFMAAGAFPDFQSITEVYPRLRLIRAIPNWDNLNNIPLANRSWDGSIYQSTKNGNLQSYISSDVMFSRHWKNGKIFAVFNTINGVIKLNAGETVTSMQNTDGYFVESGDASADFNITGNEIRLKSSVTIDVDSSNSQIKGKGYIFTLKSSGTPTVITGSATNVTSNSTTLTGTVNPGGLSTTVWFEYDTISGSYSSKSATQNVSGSSDVTVSIPISGLSPAKTYYYRIVAQSAAGTTKGAEMTFTTPDTTAPNCSIGINNGDSYTKSPTVTLILSATDDIGVTDYYLSTNSTIPLATAAGWTAVTSTTSYTASIPYTLSSGDGS
ncbi:MAG: hypothetical protein F9K48_07000, partial [Candidatus Brocadia sp.]